MFKGLRLPFILILNRYTRNLFTPLKRALKTTVLLLYTFFLDAIIISQITAEKHLGEIKKHLRGWEKGQNVEKNVERLTRKWQPADKSPFFRGHN